MKQGQALKIEITSDYWDAPALYTILPPKQKRGSIFGGGKDAKKAEQDGKGFSMTVTGSSGDGSKEKTDDVDDEAPSTWQPGEEGKIVYEIP